MKRTEQIENLDTVLTYIEIYEKRLSSKMPEYYNIFSCVDKWHRQQEVNKKCFNYWKRKFNRIIFKIQYKI